MSLGAGNLLLASAVEGYNLTRSLRFRNNASAYLSKSYSASATNPNIQTISVWTKRGQLGTVSALFYGYSNASNLCYYTFGSNDTLYFVYTVGGTTYTLQTSQVFRDASAWYHLVFAYDSTQATASNRVKLYVNGAQITSFAAAAYPPQNNNSFLYTGAGLIASIGAVAGTSNWYDGYMAELNFIDGQALTPSSFGSINALTGVWQPARYTGTYGTNGFYLPFTDNSALTTSSNVGLGKDFSGNGNYWVTNNVSITSGYTYDSITDVPTLTSATASNYCVLNPLNSYAGSLLQGNLIEYNASSTWNTGVGSIYVNSGKWYAEVTPFSIGTYAMIGIADRSFSGIGATYLGVNATSYGYLSDGQKWNSNSGVTYGATYTTGDVIGIALDLNAGTLTFYKNNVSQGVAFTGLSGYFTFGVGAFVASVPINFGQQPFIYTPPTGFLALNTFNLPTSTIVKGNTVMDATLYTGTGASLSVTNAASFKPDLVWVKGRSGATDHALYDSVRGVQKQLESNTTTAETTETTGLTAFGSAGFTVGALAQMNTSAATYVGWQWQAGQGSTSSNTSGSITSTVSVNASAGFSVVTYTGTGANATVGHGLGVAPSLVIIKDRSATNLWVTYHASLGATGYVSLNSTAAFATLSTVFNNTAPTSSVFSIGTAGGVNTTSDTYVAYCWSAIRGFSAFGSVLTNSAADNAFVYTGFLPRFILYKRSDSTSDWGVFDTARNTNNVMGNLLNPNLSSAESSVTFLDVVSNGFKLRSTGFGGTWIYAAFATTPFKNSLAF